MLCCEKRITAIVADVLYHEVTYARTLKMSRKDERKAAYCDAVRVIDRNPLPEATTFVKVREDHLRGRKQFLPLYEDVKTLLEGWRTKFPNLQKIIHDHPGSLLDPSYVAHLRDGKLYLDLQSNFVINDKTPLPSTTSTKSIFGKTPQYDGMTVERHTIAEWFNADGNREAWKKHLYSNPDLDNRVVSINHTHINGTDLRVSLDELITFLTRRQARRCAPMKALYLNGSELPGGITSEQLEQLCSALGLEARRLHIPNKLLAGHPDFSSAVSIFNQYLPKLQHLEITYSPNGGEVSQLSFNGSPQLKDLPNLRFFSLQPKCWNDAEPVDDPSHHLRVARCVYRLGTLECVFQNGNLRHVYQVKEFNEVTKKLRYVRCFDPTDIRKPSYRNSTKEVCKENQKYSGGGWSWGRGWR